MSCATDNESNSEVKNESDLIEQEIASSNARLLAKKTKKELSELLAVEGFEDIADLSIGDINGKNFNITSEKINKILGLHFKLITQKIGYNVDYNEFEFLSGKENNGYPMLVSRGKCKITGEYVSLGINIIENTNGKTQITHEGTTVTCTGCEMGCSPRRYKNGDGWCTNCEVGSSQGTNCIKTEVLN